MNVLLVEFRSKGRTHRPNLALARYSTLYKQGGHNVLHAIIDSKYKLPAGYVPDLVIVSVIFSWDVPKMIWYVNTLRKVFPKLRAEGKIIIGGVCTYHMHDMIVEGTGIEPIVGCSYALDHVIPDPTFYDDETYVFTQRSCGRNCAWCIVKDIEPKPYTIENYAEQINMNAKYVMICDNNILATDIEHRKAVFSHLATIASKKNTFIGGTRKVREVTFDSGLDFRLFTDENLDFLKQIKHTTIKMAWDDLKYESKFDEAVRRLIKAMPEENKSGKMCAYVLYNSPFTNDSIEDVLYRIYKLWNCYNILPYAMRFSPLASLTYKEYLSPNWEDKSDDCIDIGRFSNNRTVFKKAKRFLYYYGRDNEGKSISHMDDEDSDLISSVIADHFEPLKIDFSKSYKSNLIFLQEELKKRTDLIHKINVKFDQTDIFTLQTA